MGISWLNTCKNTMGNPTHRWVSCDLHENDISNVTLLILKWHEGLRPITWTIWNKCTQCDYNNYHSQPQRSYCYHHYQIGELHFVSKSWPWKILEPLVSLLHEKHLSNKFCDVGLWVMLGVAPRDNLLPKGTWCCVGLTWESPWEIDCHEHFVE